MIKIVIVDDKRINRVNRADELERSGIIKVLFTAQNGQEFLEKMKSEVKGDLPEVVLMDIDMPEKNGIDTVRDAKLIYPEVEYIMLTVFDEDSKIFEAIKAGASGYILKDENTDSLIKHISQVKEFKAVPMSPSVARKALKLMGNILSSDLIKDKDNYKLTPQEIKVLNGLVNGYDFREIAEKLIVSPNTVRNQISSIYKKLHVSCKVDAVKLAISKNLI